MVGMLDAARLARMKRTASSSHRGGIIDEKALYHALKADRIARCRARCFAVPNFIGAPHVVGAPPGGSRGTSVAAVENIVSILDGKRSATTSSTRRCWTKRPPPSSNIIHELDRIFVPRLSG
jgi:phosphoglycerate dehydrogenase-like enzyme